MTSINPTDIYDVIVVGSGPSGGRIAHEMVKSGARVLLLEAGPFLRGRDFPKSELAASAEMFWGGGVELSSDARLGFLRARCVGGTSIVNQALLDRFDEYVWDEWRAITGIPFSAVYIDDAYEHVEKSLSLQNIEPQFFNRNTKMFTEAFDKAGLGWKALRRGQKDCGLETGNDCIVCLGGCPRNSKQSTMVTSVEPAEALGLTVIANCEVARIQNDSRNVTVLAHLSGGGPGCAIGASSREVSFRGRALVLAAGSFGTSKILLQSEQYARTPDLGKRISCHPQYMTYAFFDEKIDSFKGAFQSVKSFDTSLRRKGIKFENVFAPPIATAMLFDELGTAHQNIMMKYRNMSSIEVAVRDEASGQLRVQGSKLIVDKKITHADRQKADHGLALVREMYDGLGAKHVVQCKQGFGLHLMGGCAIGSDSGHSVVAPDFRIHGQKNIFIADSSVFPSAPGLNPSLTIMALSHLAAQEIKKELA